MLATAATLIESREIAPEVRHFVFEIPGVECLDFIPGQWVSLTAEVAGQPIKRAYSIASPPGGNRFELCLNRVQDGHLSPYLFDMRPGASIAMKGPYGVFVLRQPPRDSLMVAAGTGVAPFRSILKAALPAHGCPRFTLLFGVRHEDRILYREEFEQMARQWPQFRFWPTLSRPARDGPAAPAASSSTWRRRSPIGGTSTCISAGSRRW